MKTVIFIPTYNERENIALLVPEIFEHLPEAHILVIDDNSPDGTREVVKEMMEKYPRLDLMERQGKEGLGAAYIAAHERQREDAETWAVISMDADGSHHPRYLKPMVEALKDHDVVIGSRYIRDGGVRNWEFWRKALSRCGNLYAKTLIAIGVSDLTAGFMAMRAEKLRQADFSKLSAAGYAYLMELKNHLVRDLGSSVTEVPIIFEERREGESKMSSHIVNEGLRVPLSIFFRRFFDYPFIGPVARVCERYFTNIGMLVRFGMSGGSAAVVHLLVLYIATDVFGLWYVASNVIAFIFAFIVSFTMQKFWTFQDGKNRMVNQLPKYLAITLGGLATNTGLIYLFVEYAGLWYMLSALLSSAIVAVVSFILYRRFVFV